ncbi:MAG: VOC family protein, partial [Hyphomicrobiaceae bacterium]
MDWYIHHINTPAVDVKATAAFLRDILGVIDGAWVYPEQAGELHHRDDTIAYFGTCNRGIHVVKPIATFARDNNLAHNPTVGGHVAITVSDLGRVRARLSKARIPYSDAGSYAMAGVHQIYFFDPSMNLIELNQIVAPAGGALP